ncbi:MAG TPA: RNA-binding S4 domain-containing protein [Steroidobacteraceae bacterium]|nr:RNA-binding S4 domain-containing protein [Steroidobacteraceae bacterium]
MVELYSPQMGDTCTDEGPGASRIDRWLFAVRLFKSRSLAAAAVSGGKVHVNGERVKPSRGVRPGDAVSFIRGAVEFECTVATIPPRRGPAREAVRCYDETQASQTRRAVHADRMRSAAAQAPRPDERPEKRDRRLLRRLRGRD